MYHNSQMNLPDRIEFKIKLILRQVISHEDITKKNNTYFIAMHTIAWNTMCWNTEYIHV